MITIHLHGSGATIWALGFMKLVDMSESLSQVWLTPVLTMENIGIYFDFISVVFGYTVVLMHDENIISERHENL